MKKLFILLVILLSLPTIWPLFQQGLFPMHDDTQTARVLTMGKALHDGMLPVRWSDYLGYNLGYPIFNFYAPLAYYIGGIFTFFGFSALLSTKIMMGVGMVLAGVSMYLLASSLFGKKAGLIASVFYLYAPYHALDLYVRGAVSELWAYALLPLPFYGLWGIYKTKKFRYVIVSSVSLAGIIISHNLTAMMVLPFVIGSIICLSIASGKKREFTALYLYGTSLIIGLLLSSFYAVPAFLEMQYTNVTSVLGGGSNPLDHFICPLQLWQSMWGYGGSTPGCIDGMSFMLGKIHVVFIIGGVVAAGYLLKSKRYQDFSVMAGSFVGLGLSLFMTLSYSSSIWQSISLLSFIQFPWRFLSIASLASAVIAGGVITVLGRVKPFIALVVTLVFSIICVFFYGKYFTPQYSDHNTAKYSDLSQIMWNVSKISDEYLPKGIIKPTSQKEVAIGLIQPITSKIQIHDIVEKTQTKRISLTSSQGSVRLNIASFPAWQIKVDDKEIKPRIVHGLYEFDLSEGAHRIEAVFVQTPLELVADILTIVGLSFVILGIIRTRKSKSL